MPKLYEECEFCSGTGRYHADGTGPTCPHCVPLRAHAVALTSEQAESLSRELARRDLRIVCLTRELQAAADRAAAVSAVPDVGALPLGDVLAWLEAAPDLALLQVRTHCQALLALRSEGQPVVWPEPRESSRSEGG
jgi:hypothetical protein